MPKNKNGIEIMPDSKSVSISATRYAQARQELPKRYSVIKSAFDIYELKTCRLLK